MIFRRFQKSAAEPSKPSVTVPPIVYEKGPTPPAFVPRKLRPNSSLQPTAKELNTTYYDLDELNSLFLRRGANAAQRWLALRLLAKSNLDNIYKTQKDLKSQISRWYRNTPGGFNKAVANAQNAMRNRDPRLARYFRTWTPEAVKRPVPTSVLVNSRRALRDTSIRSGGSIVPTISGTYRHDTKDIVVADPRSLGGQRVLEHELSHAAFPAIRRPLPGVQDGYLADPPEADARLAEIKRRYSYATGRHVDNLEEARRAWKWYRQYAPLEYEYSRSFPQLVEDPYNRPPSSFDKYQYEPPKLYWKDDYWFLHEGRKAPALRLHPRDFDPLSPFEFETYDKAPESTKELLLKRMLELVRNSGRTAAPTV